MARIRLQEDAIILRLVRLCMFISSGQCNIYERDTVDCMASRPRLLFYTRSSTPEQYAGARMGSPFRPCMGWPLVGVQFCNMPPLWRPTAGVPRARGTLQPEWLREPAARGTSSNVIPQPRETIKSPIRPKTCAIGSNTGSSTPGPWSRDRPHCPQSSKLLFVRLHLGQSDLSRVSQATLFGEQQR